MGRGIKREMGEREASRQQGALGAAEPQQGAVGDAIELCADRRVDAPHVLPRTLRRGVGANRSFDRPRTRPRGGARRWSDHRWRRDATTERKRVRRGIELCWHVFAAHLHIATTTAHSDQRRSDADWHSYMEHVFGMELAHTTRCK